MLKKITKEIQKLELLKEKKLQLKSEIESEITQISADLKRLYTLKSKYEDVQNGVDEFFHPSTEQTHR